MANLKTQPDDMLIRQCLDRLDPGISEEAWIELMDRYATTIKRHISLNSWDGSLEHGDLFQMVCTRLLEGALGQFDSNKGTFAQYVARVTRNVVLDEWKRVRRKIQSQIPFDEQVQAIASDASNLDEALLRTAIQDALRQSTFTKSDFELMRDIVNGEPKERLLKLYQVSEPTYYRRMAELRAILAPVLGEKRKSGSAEKKAGADS